MDLDQRIYFITKELDLIWEKMKSNEKFNHPTLQDRNPTKQQWGETIKENIWWRIHYALGDSKDSGGLIIEYSPKTNHFYVVGGKPGNNIDEKTPHFSKVKVLFKKCLIEHIIASRDDPKYNSQF